jgi:hypothetical protein
MRAARNVRAVDETEDYLVSAGALADVRVQVHLRFISPALGRCATSMSGVAVQQLEGVTEDCHDRLERLRRTLHTSRHIDDQRPSTHPCH